MKSKNEKSVRTISILIMVLSSFMAISNLGGAFVSQIIEFDFAYYFLLCVVSAFIALNFLFGSYFMLKGKNWARLFLLNISRIIIILSILFPIFTFFILPLTDEDFILKIWSIMAPVFYVIPLSFLIRYLSKDKIKNHFTSNL